MKKLLSEVSEFKSGRTAFLAMDLNCATEELHYGKIESIIKRVKDFKREFILILSP